MIPTAQSASDANSEALDQSCTTVRFLFADHIPVVTYVVLLSLIPLHVILHLGCKYLSFVLLISQDTVVRSNPLLLIRESQKVTMIIGEVVE